ncbi:hypothetical protein [Streptomyces sp. NPDC002994]|uniref:hypothetical protein n=1 Tax=Streptomyces sp. NPDC002994 TaxID=3154441 RepID=UPI0033AE6F1A
MDGPLASAFHASTPVGIRTWQYEYGIVGAVHRVLPHVPGDVEGVLTDQRVRQDSWAEFGGLFAALGVQEDAMARFAARVPPVGGRRHP